MRLRTTDSLRSSPEIPSGVYSVYSNFYGTGVFGREEIRASSDPVGIFGSPSGFKGMKLNASSQLQTFSALSQSVPNAEGWLGMCTTGSYGRDRYHNQHLLLVEHRINSPWSEKSGLMNTHYYSMLYDATILRDTQIVRQLRETEPLS
ncbi:hypothetical protein FHL15_007071 [Xylaria flabelliformis]|uniref:Uncharacterized protein n=1 Tax=Xylaria flabelliformis TaxID=2512241 RepID=A0A553HVJ8_9PEZI|nr:hypothetical protein FHL15_007071 [Xylaria flabelliformis]